MKDALNDVTEGFGAPFCEYVEGADPNDGVETRAIAEPTRMVTAMQDYRTKREAGEAQDSPEDDFPGDGISTWVRVESQDMSAGIRRYCTRYQPGPGDIEWMNRRDTRYLARLWRTDKERFKSMYPERWRKMQEELVGDEASDGISKERKLRWLQERVAKSKDLLAKLKAKKDNEFLQGSVEEQIKIIQTWGLPEDQAKTLQVWCNFFTDFHCPDDDELLKYLYDDKFLLFFKAVERGDKETVTLLLECDVSLLEGECNCGGWDVVCRAAVDNKRDRMRWLSELPFVTPEQRKKLALESLFEVVVAKWLDKKAKATILSWLLSDYGITLQDECMGSGLLFLEEKATILSWLLSDCGITLQDECMWGGLSFLLYCGRYNHFAGVDFLLDYKGTEIWIEPERNSTGQTVLHLAAMSGNSRIVALLLHYHPEIIDLVNRNNKTALYLAVERSEIKTVELLLKYGADIYTGLDPIAVAMSKGNQEIQSKLIAARDKYLQLLRKKVQHLIAQAKNLFPPFCQSEQSSSVLNEAAKGELSAILTKIEGFDVDRGDKEALDSLANSIEDGFVKIILARIRKDDSTLTHIDFSGVKLTGEQIGELLAALSKNTRVCWIVFGTNILQHVQNICKELDDSEASTGHFVGVSVNGTGDSSAIVDCITERNERAAKQGNAEAQVEVAKSLGLRGKFRRALHAVGKALRAGFSRAILPYTDLLEKRSQASSSSHPTQHVDSDLVTELREVAASVEPTRFVTIFTAAMPVPQSTAVRRDGATSSSTGIVPERGRDPNMLVAALRLQKKRAVKHLVRRLRIDPNISTPVLLQPSGETRAGTTATKEGSAHVVQQSIASATVDRQTPLRLAVTQQDVHTVRMLVRYGADVGAEDNDGRTPLQIARESGNAAVIRALLETRDRKGRTPLQAAVDECNVAAVEALLQPAANKEVNPPGKELLHTAIDKGNAEIVGLLLDAGADVTAKDEKGRTPLQAAVGESCAAVVEVLLSVDGRSNEVNLVDEKGKIPLEIAAARGDVAIVCTLLKAGSDMPMLDDEGKCKFNTVGGVNKERIKSIIEKWRLLKKIKNIVKRRLTRMGRVAKKQGCTLAANEQEILRECSEFVRNFAIRHIDMEKIDEHIAHFRSILAWIKKTNSSMKTAQGESAPQQSILPPMVFPLIENSARQDHQVAIPIRDVIIREVGRAEQQQELTDAICAQEDFQQEAVTKIRSLVVSGEVSDTVVTALRADLAINKKIEEFNVFFSANFELMVMKARALIEDCCHDRGKNDLLRKIATLNSLQFWQWLKKLQDDPEVAKEWKFADMYRHLKKGLKHCRKQAEQLFSDFSCEESKRMAKIFLEHYFNRESSFAAHVGPDVGSRLATVKGQKHRLIRDRHSVEVPMVARDIRDSSRGGAPALDLVVELGDENDISGQLKLRDEVRRLIGEKKYPLHILVHVRGKYPLFEYNESNDTFELSSEIPSCSLAKSAVAPVVSQEQPAAATPVASAVPPPAALPQEAPRRYSASDDEASAPIIGAEARFFAATPRGGDFGQRTQIADDLARAVSPPALEIGDNDLSAAQKGQAAAAAVPWT